MRIHTLYTLGLFTLLPLASCTSLDEEPESFKVTAQFYANEDDAKAAVTAIYSGLTKGSDTQSYYNRGIQLATDMGTDDYEAGPRAINAHVRAISNLQQDASNDRYERIWQDSYSIINLANTAIDRIADISSSAISDAARSQYTNEAKFLRALAYFNLVRWFRNVPLVLHQSSSLSADAVNVSQATPEEVYAQIIQDLKDAESLPTPSEYAAEDAGRATSGSAKALLAKVYLTQQQWQLAADKSKEVIDLQWYSLYDNFKHAFDVEHQNGKEHIFSVQFKANSGINHMLASTSATNEVPGINGSHADAYHEGSDLLASFAPNDQRRDVSLITSQQSPTDGKVYQLSAPHFHKYYDITSIGNQRNSSVNVPIVRYSEVYLIYAEALNELNGPTSEAYEYIDKVRTRAGIDKLADTAPDLSQAEFRDSLFEERRKEFVYEQQRWFDLSRRGADYFVKKLHAAGKTNAQPKHIVLPIPQRELDLNPNLRQNPEWAN